MTWDIIDTLDPNVQITTHKKGEKVGSVLGSVSSLVRTALVVSIAVASASFPKFSMKQSEIAGFGPPVHLKKANQSVTSGGATRGVVRQTDTQYGQSSSKLARVFPAYFQPAPAEAPDDDEYSFA